MRRTETARARKIWGTDGKAVGPPSLSDSWERPRPGESGERWPFRQSTPWLHVPLDRDGERNLLDSYPGAMVVVDDAGLVTFASPAACRLLGWDGTLVGQPLTSIIPPRMHGRHRAGFSRYVGTGHSSLQGKTVRVPALRRDGRELDVDLTIRVFRRPDGSKLVSAAMNEAPLGRAPPGLVVLEDALQKRLYQLI